MANRFHKTYARKEHFTFDEVEDEEYLDGEECEECDDDRRYGKLRLRQPVERQVKKRSR